MKVSELQKEIKDVFLPLRKKYYLGKLKHGCPYFWPRGFNKNIIKVRRLLKNHEGDYVNLPMVRRSKSWIVKDYFIEIGCPIKIAKVDLGWKDKYETPRFEFIPSWQICFFHWQFCIFWKAPVNDESRYFEMILWYLYYSDKNIIKAKETWNWIDGETKKSTWDDSYLIKNTIDEI